MTLNELIERIESQEFQAEFLVLSGFSTVLSAMENSTIVISLIDSLRDNNENQKIILERINHLKPQYVADYMHPYDVAITAYVFALNKVNQTALLELLPKLAEIKEFWWTRKFITIHLTQEETEA